MGKVNGTSGLEFESKMNPLEQAIKESKEREEKATKGVWSKTQGLKNK
jgi:hypothetical protein